MTLEWRENDGKWLWFWWRWNEFTFEDGVEFDHPGSEDGLFGESINIRQGADAPLDADAKDVAEILRGQSAGLDGPQNPIGA